MTDLKSHELLSQYQNGHSEAATAIFDRYIERLIALARSRIGSKLQRRLDAEDIVQSAYCSFFVHAKNNQYQLTRSGDLWRLLASITLNKLYSQIEKQTAAKRSIHQEQVADAFYTNAKTPDPSPVEVVAMIEQLHLVINALSPNEQFVLTARLQGQSVEEISILTKKSPRTVRRLLAQSKKQIEQMLLSDNNTSKATAKKIYSPLAKSEVSLQYIDYVLEQLIGSGGMGKVFRAKEKNTNKTVAIKTLHKSRQSDQRAVAQFVQEAEILASLHHPNIVGIKGLGQFPNDSYFIVIDYIEGIDLQSRLDQGALPLNETLSIIQQVTNAISHAHDHGIIHCDLKPGNILLNTEGQAFVTDFGFAHLFTSSVSNKTIHSIGGTAGYIAPEILYLQSQPTCAADIYSIGVLLWVLATGKAPQEPNVLQTVDNGLMNLKPICCKCLAKSPEDRYQSAKELLIDIQEIPLNL